jgi:hypothetical protein
MKKLLLGAAIAMIAISPALAGGVGWGGRSDRDIGDFDRCRGCPSWRSPASDAAPPVMGSAFPATSGGPAFPVCHLLKERIGTRHGRPVYKTWQLCG